MFYVRLTVAPEEVTADDLIPDHNGVLVKVESVEPEFWFSHGLKHVKLFYGCGEPMIIEHNQVVYRPVVQVEAGHVEPI